jgi:hypothetical protein
MHDVGKAWMTRLDNINGIGNWKTEGKPVRTHWEEEENTIEKIWLQVFFQVLCKSGYRHHKTKRN